MSLAAMTLAALSLPLPGREMCPCCAWQPCLDDHRLAVLAGAQHLTLPVEGCQKVAAAVGDAQFDDPACQTELVGNGAEELGYTLPCRRRDHHGSGVPGHQLLSLSGSKVRLVEHQQLW